MHTKNQIQFLNVNEKECLNPDDESRPVEVKFYFVINNGENSKYSVHKEFVDLLKNQRFDYKSNVCVN